MNVTEEQREAQRLRMREYRKRKKREMGKRAYLKEQRENKQEYREKLSENIAPNIFQKPSIPKKYSKMLKDLSDSVSQALEKISSGAMSVSQANVILPQLNEKIQLAPDVLVKIGDQKNCDDLLEDIVENNEKRIEDDPRLENTLPEKKSVIQQLKRVNALWRYMNNIKCTRNCKENCLDYEWTRDTEKVTKFIMKKWDKNNSRNAYFTGLSSHLRNLSGFEKEHSIYSKMSSKVYQNKILPAQKENKLSTAQKKNYVPYPVLVKNRKKLKIGSVEDAVVSMYMDAPPRRVRDYYLMKVFKEVKSKTGKKQLTVKTSKVLDKQFNYLVLNTQGNVKEMIFNAYKTQKDFGQQIIIPDKKEMNKHLKPYLKGFEIESGDFLFPTKTGKSMGDRFGSVVKKSFSLIAPSKKQPTAGLLRHSYVSYIRKEFGNTKPDSYFEAIATKMAHSYSTSLAYRVLDDA